MGTIQKLSKGKYKLSVEAGTDDKGKRLRRYRTVSASGLKDARKLLETFEEELFNANRTNYTNMLFIDFVAKWRENYAIPHLEPSTLEVYEILLRSIVPAFRRKTIEEVHTFDITQYLNKEQANGNGSLEKKYNVLKSIFKYAVKWKVLENDPMVGVKKPKNPQKEMEFYDLEEMKHLMEEIATLDSHQQLKIKFALIGGLRRGEILGLADDMISWESNQIKILRSLQFSTREGLRLKRTKTGDSRVITFPSWFMQELKRHYIEVLHQRSTRHHLWKGFEDTDGKQVLLIFADEYGQPHRPNSLTQFWGKFMKRHPQLKRIRFQDLRHSSASLLLSEGINIKVLQKRLGHKRANTTLNVYAHVTERDDQKASDIFNDFA